MICTIYSHYLGFEKVSELLQQAFPKGVLSVAEQNEDRIAQLVVKGGLFSSGTTVKITYRQRRLPSYQLPETDDSALTGNLRGLYGYVSSLPSSNDRIKNLLLRKVLTLNSEFSIVQEPAETKDIKTFIQKLALEFDAIVFAQPGTLISKSNSQHFLDKNLELLIDTQGNCMVQDLDVKIESHYFDAEESELTEEQMNRKKHTENILRARNIKINSNLPCIAGEQETVVRTPKEIATRLCVLAVNNFVANGVIPVQAGMDYLHKYNLWQYTTPDEKDFLNNPTQEKRNAESWKSECIYVLLWALGIVSNLNFPDELCDLNTIGQDVYPVGADKDPNDFIASIAEARSAKEIIDANDLYYRIDWACVDARINNLQMQEVNAGVVYERHYALNWLVNYGDQDWDDVSCDT
jgi:hypothetical protein